MKILVIGGSYFYGRVFVMLAAKEHDITVVNRGTYSMEEFGVRQIKGDRHDAALWRQCGESYDAAVDFCAYEPGDIETVLENLSGSVRQYILISTVDVYRRQGGAAVDMAPAEKASAGEAMLKDEETPFETRHFPGEAGAYISGKVALEEELRKVCGEKNIACTVLRPAILYGPYNYAPRESLFIRMAVKDRVLPRFTDAEGRFQFVYVKDAAEAVLRCLGNGKAFGRAYNLCGDEVLDYDLFFRKLAGCAGEAEVGSQELCMTLEEARTQGIPVPFPATAEETELVSNARSKGELNMEYTPLCEGMRKTFNAFRHVFI